MSTPRKSKVHVLILKTYQQERLLHAWAHLNLRTSSHTRGRRKAGMYIRVCQAVNCLAKDNHLMKLFLSVTEQALARIYSIKAIFWAGGAWCKINSIRGSISSLNYLVPIPLLSPTGRAG